MVDLPENNTLNEKEKKKFVNNMMKLANESKKSSEEEISSQVDKRIRHFNTLEGIFYILTILLTFLLTYFFLM